MVGLSAAKEVKLPFIGTRSLTIPTGDGSFQCPECGGTEYKAQRVRRFVTVSVVPVVPLGLIGEYIECQLCKGTYDQSVLDLAMEDSLSQVEATFSEAIKRVMILMMLADRRVEDPEITAIIEVYGQVTGRELTRADIKREVLIAVSQGEDLDQYLSGLLGKLNNDGKELVIKSAFLIAKSDGHLDERELTLLHRIGGLLELSSEHIEDVVYSAAGQG